MKKFLFYSIFCLLPQFLSAQYERIGGISRAPEIVSIENTYYSFSESTLYKSDDQGENWDVVNQHVMPEPMLVTSLFAYDTLLYVSILNGEIMRSVDRGVTFTSVSPYIGYEPSSFFQTNDSILFVRNKYFSMLSTDNGESFETLQGQATVIECLYTDELSFFIEKPSSNTFNLHRSNDHFVTSETIPIPTEVGENILAVGVFEQNIIFGTDTYGHVNVSSDQGDSWQAVTVISDAGSDTEINAFHVMEDSLFVATDAGIYKTTDPNLQNWEHIDFNHSGHLNGRPMFTDIYQLDNQLIVNMEGVANFRRDSTGAWHELKSDPVSSWMRSIFNVGEELFATGGRYELHRSRDGGFTFDLYRSPLLARYVSWDPSLMVNQFDDVSFSYHPHGVSGGFFGGLYRYEEGDTEPVEQFNTCRFMEMFNDTLWALNESYLFISADLGQTWETRADFYDVNSFGTPNNNLYGMHKYGNAVTVLLGDRVEDGRIMHSNDNGITFTEVLDQRTYDFSAQDSIIVTSVNINEFGDDGIFVSENAGLSWASRPIPGLLDQHISNIVVRDGIIMANTTTEIYFSSDFGLSWHLYPQNHEQVISFMNIHHNRGDWLVSTIQPYGLYRLDDNLINCIGGITESENCTLLSGRVFYDDNSDCVYDDTDEFVYPYILRANPGGYLFSTNEDGYYRIGLPLGQYSVEVSNPILQNWEVICPENGQYDVLINEDSPSHDTLDFTFAPLPDVYDLTVNLTQTGGVRIGEHTHFWLQCKNEGTIMALANFNFTFPNTLQLVESSMIPTTTSSTELGWDFGALQPNEQVSIHLTFLVENNVEFIGEFFQTSLQAEPLEEEDITTNNSHSLSLIYNGAYDPNDKNVEPKGEGVEGLIPPSNVDFIFTIRFQNTGNDFARRVTLLDTLANIFDPLTFRMLAASHEYQFELLNNHILEWDFVNINLPDSTMNESESHGFVTFSIQLKESLPIDATIENDAAIYFDLNPPIFTNRTLNTIGMVDRINTIRELPKIDIFPNPTRERFTLLLPESLLDKELTLDICSLNGQVVYTLPVDRILKQEIILPQLPIAPYLLQIRTLDELVTEPFFLIIQ